MNKESEIIMTDKIERIKDKLKVEELKDENGNVFCCSNTKSVVLHLDEETTDFLKKMITECEVIITKNAKSPEDREGWYEPVSLKNICEEMIYVLKNQFQMDVNNQAYKEIIENLTIEN